MRLKYLGTAAAEGWPALFCRCEACERARVLGGKNIRTRSQAIIDDRLLIDFCSDTYMHVLEQHVPLENIRHVLITHSHNDHLYVSDLINAGEPYAHGMEAPVTLYGTPGGKEKLNIILKLEDDAQNLSERLVYRTVREFEPFKVLDYVVTPLLAKHMADEKCYIYMIEDKDGRTLLYGNDTAWFPEETWMYIKDRRFDMVSLDCTTVFGPDCQSHMGFAGDVKTKEKLLAMGCADENTTFILTHFSHNGLASHEEIEARGKEEGFLTAYDGFEAEV